MYFGSWYDKKVVKKFRFKDKGRENSDIHRILFSFIKLLLSSSQKPQLIKPYNYTQIKHGQFHTKLCNLENNKELS